MTTRSSHRLLESSSIGDDPTRPVVGRVEVRKELVRVGVELLERDGLGALTLRRIAREAGVSHGAPRNHFPTYASLLAAIARTGIEDLDAELTPRLALPDPRAALREAARCYLGFAVRRPEMFELIARHDLLSGAGEHLGTITGPWFASAGSRIAEIRGRADPRHAVALWAGVHGLASIVGRRAAEAVAADVPEPDAVIDVLINGLLNEEN